MKQRKITRTVIYYDDGSYEEVNASPAFQPTKPIEWPNIDPKPTCPKCGLIMEKVMAYSCPHNNCPVGFGPRAVNYNEWELK